MKSHRFTDFPEQEENTSEQVRITEDADRIYMARIYNWMAGGLAITGLTAWKISSLMVDPTSIFNRAPGMFLILLILVLISLAASAFTSALATGFISAGRGSTCCEACCDHDER